jgi:hypothetical protein
MLSRGEEKEGEMEGEEGCGVFFSRVDGEKTDRPKPRERERRKGGR